MLWINFGEQPGVWVLSPGLPHSPELSMGAQLKFHFPRSLVCFSKTKRKSFLCAAGSRALAQPGNSTFGAQEEADTAHLGSEFRNAFDTLTPEFSNSLFTMYLELLVCRCSLLCLEFFSSGGFGAVASEQNWKCHFYPCPNPGTPGCRGAWSSSVAEIVEL